MVYRRRSRRMGLRSRLRKLERRMRGNTMSAVMTHIDTASRQLSCLTGQVKYDEFRVNFIEDWVDMFKEMYTIATTNDAGAETVQQIEFDQLPYMEEQVYIYIIRTQSQLTIRNNFNIPVWVEIYKCVAKQNIESGDTPLLSITNGLDSLYHGDSSWEVNRHFYPSDSTIFKQLYKVKDKCTALLNPGDEIHKTMLGKRGWLNMGDVQALNAKGVIVKRFWGGYWLIRITGVIAHESDSISVNTAAAKVDINVDIKTIFKWKKSQQVMPLARELNTGPNLTIPAVRTGTDPAKETSPTNP